MLFSNSLANQSSLLDGDHNPTKDTCFAAGQTQQQTRSLLRHALDQ